MAYDAFGDGWDNARLIITPSIGSPYTITPKCSKYYSRSKFCFTSDKYKTGDFVVISVVGYKPARYWEIFWQVRNDEDLSIYSGSYTTTMTFVYKSESHDNTNNISKITINNELPRSMACETCQSYTHIPINEYTQVKTIEQMYISNEQHNKNDDKKKIKLKRGLGEVTNQILGKSLFTKPIITPKIESNKNSKDIILGKGNMNSLSYSIYADSNNWNSTDGFGVNFYVFDTTGQELYYSGNLCGTNEGLCGLQLDDGEYMWRVSTSGGAEVYWEFCNTKGDSTTELTFTWKQSTVQCVPLQTRSVLQICTLLKASTDV